MWRTWLACWVYACVLAASLIAPGPLWGQFRLPTPNTALFEPGGECRFFARTPGGDWSAGTFGCTRSDGDRWHEGIDILATQRDGTGEPIDPIFAASDGRVAYINTNPALSNYGRCIVVQHQIESLVVWTIYAHLRSVAPDLRPGQPVRSGQTIGVLGRSTNTRTPIAKERAHLHFEMALQISDRFDLWFRKVEPKQRNDHGNFNGQNFIGLDPAEVFLRQRELGARFSLLAYIQHQTPLCTVRIRRSHFPWVHQYPALVMPAPAGLQPVVGYDVTFSF
ncbi:MAG: M23 family metallopeptidase [Verrucomicrobiota bacterium]|nr:M23 family metallopeptidase [Limisphaera sp.]MDW8382069.1 M23 family metallopeptidase [Verrucomicrobiota bacterium]